MKNTMRLAFLLLSVTISACVPSGAATTMASPSAGRETSGMRTVPTVVERMGPVFATWEFAEDPHLKDVGASLAFHWIELSPDVTTLVYSLYPAGAALLHDGALALRSESGESRSPVQIIPLAQFDRIEVGVLRFGPRPFAARSLILYVPGAQASQPLAAAEGQPEELHYDSRYYSRVEEVRQSEYRIHFAGPYLIGSERHSAESATAADDFATPAPKLPVRPLPAGREPAVASEMTLQISQTDSEESHTLGIQFLDDGRIIALVDGVARLAHGAGHQPRSLPRLSSRAHDADALPRSLKDLQS